MHNFVEVNGLAHLGVVMDGYAQLLDNGVAFQVHDVFRQPVIGYAVTEHASVFRVAFVYGDFVALQPQVISGRETSWSRSDDGDFSAGGFFWWFRQIGAAFQPFHFSNISFLNTD